MIVVAVVFLLGLCARTSVFVGDHVEGDEIIYRTLVEQLDAGAGYTLQGSEALERGAIDKQIYDKPLFFHPPGGVVLFWLSQGLFGDAGYGLAQLFSFAVFYWSMIYLASLLGVRSSRTAMISVAGLSAFAPIMAHVSTNYWLDGPLLAFSTLASAVFVGSVVHGRLSWACIAGVLLGAAAWTKVTALLVVPGLLLLAWSVCNSTDSRRFAVFAGCFVALAGVVVAPWIAWHWIELGAPLTGSAGNPADSLVQSNRYIHFVTVVRSPWIYLTVLPRILWTLGASALIVLLLRDNKSLADPAVALVVWIAVIVAIHVGLGYAGYSKLLRYVILVTPASILLFGVVVADAFGDGASSATARPALSRAIAAVAVVAFLLEVATGVRTSLALNVDLIIPLVGGV